LLIADVGRWCEVQRSVSRREPGYADGGLAAWARGPLWRRHIKTRESAAKSRLGGDPLGGGLCRRKAPGLRQPCTFHGGCGESGPGPSLYVPCAKAGGAAGVPVARLEGQVRGKTTPSSWNTWVRHGGQAGVNRQAPWQGSEGNLGVRDRNHQGMGARSFQCRWQTSTECILALIERG
jgi:hypothetical protein